MALHIDVVRSELSAGTSPAIARVTIVNGDLHVDSEHAEVHRQMLLDALGPEVRLDNPREALQMLHDRFQGSYIFATEPHEAGACPYDKEFERHALAVGGAHRAKNATLSKGRARGRAQRA